MVDDDEARESLEQVDRLSGCSADRIDERYRSCRVQGLGFAWERHTEFITYTFIAEANSGALFDLRPFAALTSLLSSIPGSLIRASHVQVLPDKYLEPSASDLSSKFSADDLISCDVADGRSRIWTDFRLHEDGFGRLLIADRGLIGNETHQLVQRLQEVGSYRKMALLGLPVARRLMPRVAELEQRLAKLTRAVADAASDDHAVLAELSCTAAEIAQIMAETRFRMSATKAYAELCMDRIRRLAVERLPGYRSLADFTERRLSPAVRTCAAFSERLDDLARQSAWTSALLRTRIDTDVAKQSRDLLTSMDRRTTVQLDLQQAVERLSIIALSYYSIGLIRSAAELAHVEIFEYLDAFSALIVPCIVLAIWYGARRLMHRSRT